MASNSQFSQDLDDLSPTGARRRRLSVLQQRACFMSSTSSFEMHSAPIHGCDHDGCQGRQYLGGLKEEERKAVRKNTAISLSSTNRQAEKSVAPFLIKHIPQVYNPLPMQDQMDESNTKYCYRHRPDLKCRRQANEPSMEQLQNELGALPPPDQQGIAHVWSLFSAAPAKHRQLMLQGILAQCCFPQLSYIASVVQDLIKIDFISALPAEIAFKILCYLDTTSLCKAAQVSRTWRMLADDDYVWHRMCEQHIDRKCSKCGWGLPLLERKRLRHEKRQIQLRASGRGLNRWSPAITYLPDTHETSSRESSAGPANLGVLPGTKRGTVTAGLPSPGSPTKRLCTEASGEPAISLQPRKRPWKDVYKDRFKVGTNWKHGRCDIRSFKAHDNGVMCLQFDDQILATGSYDCTIKIWDIETDQEIKTPIRTLAGEDGHTAGIRCLLFDDTLLFSGSLDRTLKVWNWRTGQCIRTFANVHGGGIICLHYSGGILVSGSLDATIRVYNLRDQHVSDSGKRSVETFLLRGHTDWVNSVKIDAQSDTIFSASDDRTVRLWDLKHKRLLRVFQGHVGQVQQVILLPHEFEFGDDEDHDHEHEHEHRNSADISDSESITSRGARSFTSHTPLDPASPAEASQHFFPLEPDRPAPPRYMITAGLDGFMRLWDVYTGRYIRTFFGHLEGIWAIAADTLRVVSGAEDRMVKVWDPRTGKCERTYTGHQGPVTCIGLGDSRFITGSEDCWVRIHSFN